MRGGGDSPPPGEVEIIHLFQTPEKRKKGKEKKGKKERKKKTPPPPPPPFPPNSLAPSFRLTHIKKTKETVLPYSPLGPMSGDVCRWSEMILTIHNFKKGLLSTTLEKCKSTVGEWGGLIAPNARQPNK